MEHTTMSGPVQASDVHATKVARKELATVKVAKRRAISPPDWLLDVMDNGCYHVSRLPEDDPWDRCE